MRIWRRRVTLPLASPSIVALLIAGLQLACGGADCPSCPTERVCPTPMPTPVPTPTPEPTPDYTGFWSGWGTSLELLSFTVSDNENARNVHYFYARVWSEVVCSRWGTGNTLAGPFPLASAKLVLEIDDASRGFTGTIAVTFTSETTATATMTMHHVDPADPCLGQQLTDSITLTKAGL